MSRPNIIRWPPTVRMPNSLLPHGSSASGLTNSTPFAPRDAASTACLHFPSMTMTASRCRNAHPRYRSSAFAEHAFCPRCGSQLWFNDVEDGAQPRSYELMPGLFDAARSWPLRSEIYVDRAMDSVRLLGNHRRKTRAEYEARNPSVDGDMK